jgi:hypothetical protein
LPRVGLGIQHTDTISVERAVDVYLEHGTGVRSGSWVGGGGETMLLTAVILLALVLYPLGLGVMPLMGMRLYVVMSSEPRAGIARMLSTILSGAQ